MAKDGNTKRGAEKPAGAKLPAGGKSVPMAKAQPKLRTGGLGRGLDALISRQTAAAGEAAGAIREAKTALPQEGKEDFVLVSPHDIHRSPWQPRGTFNAASLKELADTIKSHGLIQPLTCRKVEDAHGWHFELISGERRLRASIEAGLEKVPVRIISVPDRDAAEMAIIENVQRDDLNAIEEAEGYQTLMDKFGLTQQEVADRVGKDRSSVTHLMRILDLPDEVKHLVSEGRLSLGHAKVLLSAGDERDQTEFALKCVISGLSVRALERALAKHASEKKNAGKLSRADVPEFYAKDVISRMQHLLSAPVRLKSSVLYDDGKRTKGTIEIDFADGEDLGRILSIMKVPVDE